ncbi:MAG: YdeI/OmpD-associated family protein [Novosphingobium sp.]
MAQDARIDAYIEKAAPFAQPILKHIRTIVHASVEGLEETIKWGMPHFLHNGKNLAAMSAFKAHCAMMIHGDGRQGDAMGQFGRLTSISDLPADDALKSKIVEARQRIDEGGTALRKKPAAVRASRTELPIPPEFDAALQANPAAKATLEAFAPSHRREYLDWISEAKRPETRDKRIAQAITWLSGGKKRNWKYESC